MNFLLGEISGEKSVIDWAFNCWMVSVWRRVGTRAEAGESKNRSWTNIGDWKLTGNFSEEFVRLMSSQKNIPRNEAFKHNIYSCISQKLKRLNIPYRHRIDDGIWIGMIWVMKFRLDGFWEGRLSKGFPQTVEALREMLIRLKLPLRFDPRDANCELSLQRKL